MTYAERQAILARKRQPKPRAKPLPRPKVQAQPPSAEQLIARMLARS